MTRIPVASVSRLAVLFGLVAATPLWAQRVPDYLPSGLASRALQAPELRAATTIVEGGSGLVAPATARAEEAFRAIHGAAPGDWWVTYDARSGRPESVLGRGIPWVPGKNALTWQQLGVAASDDAAAAAYLEARARAFVREQAAWLGIDERDLVLGPTGIQHPAPYLFYLQLDWAPHGIPAEDAYVVFRLNHGNVVQFGTHGIADRPASPAIGIAPDTAWRIARAYSGWDPARDEALTPVPALLWVRMTPDPSARESWTGGFGQGYRYVPTYEVALRRAGAAATWRVRIDARSGEVFEFADVNAYGQIHGKIYQIGPAGSETDRPFPYGDYGAGAFANLAGTFPGTSGSCALAGEYIKVADTCGSISLTTTSGDIDFGGGTGNDCTTPVGNTAGPGNTHASRSSYYHLTLINEKGRTYLPGNSWLQTQLTDNVNSLFYGFKLCNAFWDGTAVNFFQSANPDIFGNKCANSGEVAAIYLHEWGHGLDQNDGNGSSPDGGTGETYGDVTALLQTHESCMGPGFFLGVNCAGYGDACTSCDGVRDIDYAKHTSGQPHTPANFTSPNCPNGSGAAGPCGKEVHCESYPSSEAVYDLATRDLVTAGLDPTTAWQVADRLWYLTRGTSGSAFTCTLPNSNGCGASNFYMIFLVADDCDGNLANGTPHMQAIYNALNRHAIACATPTVQNQSCCPNLAAPALTATPIAGGINLTWSAVAGATSYSVFRNEFGCSAGYTQIGSTTAPTVSFVDSAVANGVTYYYRVQPLAGSCSGAMSNCGQATAGGGGGGGGADVIVGEGLGPSNPNTVKVYTGAGSATAVSFNAYAAGAWGVNVAGADLSGAGAGGEQILTGPGPGPIFGPQVRAFDRTGASMGKVNFYAYGTLKFGVNVAGGNVDGDAFDEIVSGAGPGAVFGPHVRGWNFDNGAIGAIAKINFFAYNTLKFGVNVTSESVDADAFHEIVTGAGPGTPFGPQVRGFNYDGAAVTSIGKINFFAFSTTQFGTNVAAGSVDGDAFAELACAPGPGSGAGFAPRFVGFDYDGASITSLSGFDVTVNGARAFGGRVGLGDVDGDATEELLAGEGRDGSSDATVRVYKYSGSALSTVTTFNPFPGAFYGVNPAGGDLGY